MMPKEMAETTKAISEDIRYWRNLSKGTGLKRLYWLRLMSTMSTYAFCSNVWWVHGESAKADYRAAVILSDQLQKDEANRASWQNHQAACFGDLELWISSGNDGRMTVKISGSDDQHKLRMKYFRFWRKSMKGQRKDGRIWKRKWYWKTSVQRRGDSGNFRNKRSANI